MLYSLAAAASMDQKRGVAALAQNGHPPMHSHGGQSSIPAFIPSGPEQVPIDWNHFQTDMAVLLQDDLGTHLEYGGDGWAF